MTYVVNVHNWYTNTQKFESHDRIFDNPGEAADFIRHLPPECDWGIIDDQGQWLEVMVELYYFHPSVEKFTNLTLEEAKRLRQLWWEEEYNNDKHEPELPVLAMLISIAEEYDLNHLGTAYDLFQWEHVYT